MTRFIMQTLATVALALLIAPGQLAAQTAAQPAPQPAAQSKEVVKTTVGDWEVRCAEGQDKLCVITQVGKTADGKIALEVRIRKLEGAKTQDGKVIPAAIQITTPLGSILPSGVRFQIDGAEPRTGMFEVCVPSGCVVRDAMSDEFLGKLKAGQTATLTFTMLQHGDIAATISLKGFTKAFDGL